MEADTTRRPRIAALDGLRAVACLMVLLYHSFQFTGLSSSSVPWPLRLVVLQGASGVDIFIVLSGFCLFLPVANKPDRFTARRFAIQRVRRIVPAYYASIAYVVALPFVLKGVYHLLGQATHTERFPSPAQLITHLFFVHTLSARTWDGLNGSYWSLGLEAQFYVLLPLLVFAYRRIGTKALVMACVVGIVWQIVLQFTWHDAGFVPAHFLWASNVFARLAEFGGGMLAAYVVAGRPPKEATARRLSLIGAATAISFLVVEGTWSTSETVQTAAWGISIGVLLVGLSCGGGPVRFTLELPWLTALGLISYSFYLVHQPTVYYVSQLASKVGITGWENWLVQLTLGAGAVVVLAIISFRLFELPFLHTRPSITEARVLRLRAETPSAGAGVGQGDPR